MQPFRIETFLPKDGMLTLENLPFRAGEYVEVTVKAAQAPQAETDRYPLRGTIVRFEQPTEPVDQDTWEAAS